MIKTSSDVRRVPLQQLRRRATLFRLDGHGLQLACFRNRYKPHGRDVTNHPFE
jgi:hypothetical protein